MDILLPIHNVWIKKILSGEKNFDFRSILPKELNVGSTIYMYETSKNHGRKTVVGEFKVKSILDLRKNGRVPVLGAYDFIEYWCREKQHDENAAKLFTAAKDDSLLPNYKRGSTLKFALSSNAMDYIRKNHDWPDIYCLSLKATQDSSDSSYEAKQKKEIIYQKIKSDIHRADDYIEKCDNWLRNIGFYDSDDMSYWIYAIEICDVKEYKVPLSLSNFNKRTGEPILSAPQSFTYVIKNK